jgi:hypothetical protein
VDPVAAGLVPPRRPSWKERAGGAGNAHPKQLNNH